MHDTHGVARVAERRRSRALHLSWPAPLVNLSRRVPQVKSSLDLTCLTLQYLGIRARSCAVLHITRMLRTRGKCSAQRVFSGSPSAGAHAPAVALRAPWQGSQGCLCAGVSNVPGVCSSVTFSPNKNAVPITSSLKLNTLSDSPIALYVHYITRSRFKSSCVSDPLPI